MWVALRPRTGHARPFLRHFSASIPSFRQPNSTPSKPKSLRSNGTNKNGFNGRTGPHVTAKPTALWTPRQAQAALASKLSTWINSPDAQQILRDLGIASVREFYPAFKKSVLPELKLEHANNEDDPWRISYFIDEINADRERGLHKAILNRFIDFILVTLPQTSSTHQHLARVRRLTDLRYPAENYGTARLMKRKIIMHVGPTNSGKTYNALRALAAAPVGVYAGPLRLLAHEVWERLNNGSITAPPKDTAGVALDLPLTPSEVPPASPDSSPSPFSSASPSASPPPLPPQGRACNLVTGEEVRVVDLEAGLTSCTVEMIDVNRIHDVAVIDEIQMLADPYRGPAWTTAVLGVRAREVHLCGEDTVVELVRRMCEQTGDDFVVNEYKRLTPLQLSKSINGDFSKIRKGDCLVAFSRNRIFSIKSKVERTLGMRCAVAYGRLPPEVRSEQAHHFNEEDSGFDVMVASDAIGMGLNLKIKRVIFMGLTKFNGKELEPLSLSQTKQIAGRAGRFGLHKDGGVGEVTTLFPTDLPQLEAAIASTNPQVHKAIIDSGEVKAKELFYTLPRGSGHGTLYRVLDQVSLPGKDYRLISYDQAIQSSAVLDEEASDCTFEERRLFHLAPIQWRDSIQLGHMRRYIHAYKTNVYVDLRATLEGAGAFEPYHDTRQLMEDHLSRQAQSPGDDAGASSFIDPDDANELLEGLEVLHKSLISYLWLSYRLPLGFSDQALGLELKGGVEKAIDFVLQFMRSKTSNAAARRMASQEPQVPTDKASFAWEYGSGSITPSSTGNKVIGRFTQIPE